MARRRRGNPLAGVGGLVLIGVVVAMCNRSPTAALPADPAVAEATAQAVAEAVAANDPRAQDHMGSGNAFKEASRARPIYVAAALEDYQEVVNLAPNSFVAPASTEIAQLGPTATAQVRAYFATATTAAVRQTLTPEPIAIASGGTGARGGGSGCGSRGGPGFRKPNGQCASWRDVR